MKTSTKLWLTGVSALALMGAAATARAADMALKAPPPPPLPITNWTGFSISGLVGVGSLTSVCNNQFGPTSDYGCATDAPHGQSSSVAKHTGGIAGVEIGYDWQQRYFVFGVAADWTWTRLKATATGASGSFAYQGKVDWLASFRGRMGLAVDDTLVYITAGLALGGVKDSVVLGPSHTDSETFKHTYVGWVAGLGVQHQFNRNWSFKAEYLHYELGRHNATATIPTTSYFKFEHTVDVARVGFTYRFGGDRF